MGRVQADPRPASRGRTRRPDGLSGPEPERGRAAAVRDQAGALGRSRGLRTEPGVRRPGGPDGRGAPLPAGPAVVRFRQTLRHGLLVRNRTDGELQIATNGHVTAWIVDPQTGEEVGGFSGWQTLPLVTFRIGPGGTERIPLLIGTASFTVRLGYAVPPGNWGLQATLDLAQDPGERVSRRIPVLPLTITA